MSLESRLGRLRASVLTKVIAPLAATFALATCNPEQSNCTNDTDCPQSHYCIDTLCEPECVTDIDCASNEYCVDSACEREGVEPTKTGEGAFISKIENAAINYGVTNDRGEVHFTDFLGEDVVVSVTNSSNRPLSGTHVIYFDRVDSESFFMEHKEYVPRLEIAAHNSNHAYSLTSSGFQKTRYDSHAKERNQEAAGDLHQWKGWTNYGCSTKDDLSALADANVIFIKYFFGELGYESAAGHAAEVKDYIFSKLDEDTVGDFHSFIPREHAGLPLTTTLATVTLRPKSAEIRNNGIDDNCDGRIDEQDCQETEYQNVCRGSSVYRESNCGTSSFVRECSPPAYCQAGACRTDDDDCQETFQYRCFEGDSWKYNLCGDRLELYERCVGDEVCNDAFGVCRPRCERSTETRCLSDGNVHLYNSCGEHERLLYNCSHGCEAGECLEPSCRNECSSDRCNPTQGIDRCRDDDRDGCREYVLESCPPSTRCQRVNNAYTCVDACDPLPQGWIRCACPEQHGAQCHADDLPNCR